MAPIFLSWPSMSSMSLSNMPCALQLCILSGCIRKGLNAILCLTNTCCAGRHHSALCVTPVDMQLGPHDIVFAWYRTPIAAHLED